MALVTLPSNTVEMFVSTKRSSLWREKLYGPFS